MLQTYSWDAVVPVTFLRHKNILPQSLLWTQDNIEHSFFIDHFTHHKISVGSYWRTYETHKIVQFVDNAKGNWAISLSNVQGMVNIKYRSM